MNLTWTDAPALPGFWRADSAGAVARFGPLHLRVSRAGSELWTWRVDEHAGKGVDLAPPLAVSRVNVPGRDTAQREARAAVLALSWDTIAAVLDRSPRFGAQWPGWGPYARDVAAATAERFRSDVPLGPAPESPAHSGYSRARADFMSAKADDDARTARTAHDARTVVLRAISAAGWALVDQAAPGGVDMGPAYNSAANEWHERCRLHLLLHLGRRWRGEGLPSNLCSLRDDIECYGWAPSSTFGHLPAGWTVSQSGTRWLCPACAALPNDLTVTPAESAR